MPHIETTRLLVRPLRPEDVPALIALWTDPLVTRYMGGPRQAERVREALQAQLGQPAPADLEFWPIVEKATGRVIGDCGLLEKEVDGQREIELIYVLAADTWGRGYATEVAGALRDHAFRDLGLRRLIALIDPANTPSARVAEKIGMRLEKETVRPSGTVRRVYAMQAPLVTGKNQ